MPVPGYSPAVESRPGEGLLARTIRPAVSNVEPPWPTNATYLLLHLSHLELVSAELPVINVLAFVSILLRNHVLDLPHQTPACLADRLAGFLESVLRAASKMSFDPARCYKLGRGGGDLVAGNDELLRTVPAADDAVRCLDQSVGRGSDGFGGADQPFGPPIVLLVKGSPRGRPTAVLDDFLLRCSGSLDQLGDGVGDGDGSFEDAVVDPKFVGAVALSRLLLHHLVQTLCRRINRLGRIGQLLIHQISEISCSVGDFARPRSKNIRELGQPLKVHQNFVVVVDDDIGLFGGFEAFKAEGLERAKEIDRGERGLTGSVDQLIGSLFVSGKASQTLGVAEDISDGACKHTDGADDVGVRAVGAVGDEIVESSRELGGAR